MWVTEAPCEGYCPPFFRVTKLLCESLSYIVRVTELPCEGPFLYVRAMGFEGHWVLL